MAQPGVNLVANWQVPGNTWKAKRPKIVGIYDMTGEQVFSSSTLEFKAVFVDTKSGYVCTSHQSHVVPGSQLRFEDEFATGGVR